MVAACDAEESRWAGTITDSAGVTIVSNPPVGIWTDTDRWTFSEVLKIGVVEGDPNYMFGQLKGVGVLSDGHIVLSDGMAQHLRFFSPDGRYEQTLGRPGSGPGEFGGPLAEAAAHFDVFDRQGRYLGVVTPPERFWLGRLHGDYAYGRWMDSLDVQYLKVLRIHGLPPLERE